MRVPKLGLAAIALVGGLSLGGCADYMSYGVGGFGGYPYSGVSLGVGYGGGYSPYYGGYGYGAYSPFGWYDDFYYPGTGIYVYDSYRRPRVWSDRQRSYWSRRSGTWSHNNGSNWQNGSRQPNWSGFERRGSDHHGRDHR